MSKPSPAPIYLLRGNNGPITSSCFIPANDKSEENLVSGFSNGTLAFWNMKTFRIVDKWQAHDAEKSVLCCKYYGGKLYSQGRTEYIKEWIPAESSWKENNVIAASINPGFCNIDISKLFENSIIAVPGFDLNKLQIFDLNSTSIIQNIDISSNVNKIAYGSIMNLSFGAENEFCLFIGCENGSLLLFDLRTWKLVNEINFGLEGIMCLSYNSGTKQGFAGFPGDKLCKWSFSESNELFLASQITIKNPGLSSINIRNDGKVCATGGWDHRIRYFNAKTSKPLAVLDCHSDVISCLSFNSSGHLAAGSRDGYVSLWNLYAGQ